MAFELLRTLGQELHKKVQRQFPRRKVISFFANEIWGADLVDLQEWEKTNKGYKYLLTVMDIFSRYAWVKPLKTKTAAEVQKAFQSIMLQDKVMPSKLWVDKGSEFYNKTMKTFLTKNKIKIYSTYSEFKVGPIENFNKILKTAMWKLFTKNNNRDWISIIDKLVHHYNNTKQKQIGMTPTEAQEDKNHQKLLNSQFVFFPEKKKNPAFKVGDRVRISRVKGVFEKGYLPKWSHEIYKIAEVKPTQPYTYVVNDGLGNRIEGTFYEPELQKTKQEDIFLIEEVLQKKKVKGKNMLFVKWLGLPKSFNSWVAEEDAPIV